jgi:HSP20 family molecular chaperone IbpA
LKLKLLLVLLCSLAVPVFSQAPATPAPATPTQVAVSGADKTQIELAMTKLENTQLKGQTLQSQAKEQMAALAKEYSDEQTAYEVALAAARKDLKLSGDATFNQKTFTFTIPVTKPEPTKPAVPTK